ncbi:hypothetical protein MTR67_013292, partial [Solanum verrucosum]
GSTSSTSLIQLSTQSQFVSLLVSKPGQGFTWGQEWFSSASLAQGVGSGCDKLGNRAQSSRVLGSL